MLSPEELAERVASQELAEGDDETPLWEELANDVLWTIPFGFLYTAMWVSEAFLRTSTIADISRAGWWPCLSSSVKKSRREM